MTNLNVTYADMEQAAGQLKAGHQTMHAELQRLYKICQHLTSSTYITDKSSGAFMTSYTQFNTGANQMMDGLQGMATFLTSAAQALSDTDQHLANSLNKG